jgi:acyl-CoA:acyl-CoA alkyltransferase
MQRIVVRVYRATLPMSESGLTGLVVSCETAREIVELAIGQLRAAPTMDLFRMSLATMTGGSGAAAVLLSDGSYAQAKKPRLLGGVTRTAPEHYRLCHWGMEETSPATFRQFMYTDSIEVLKHGAALGCNSWADFLREMAWTPQLLDKAIFHQVGSAHRDMMLKVTEIPEEKDFSTYEFLGNMGTVSLPLTAAWPLSASLCCRGIASVFSGSEAD